jgi:biopolymer transport protein ExbB
VLRLGSFAAYACGEGRAACGLLREGPGQRPIVAGPYLTERQTEWLRRAVAGDLERLPLDVDGRLSGWAPPSHRGVTGWLAAGGIFVYPIIFAAALGLVLTFERLRYLVHTRRSPALIRRVRALLEADRTADARRAAAASRGPTARVLLAGVEAHGGSQAERETAMESALLAEAPRIERSLSLLGALAAVAPLLGLLGTVSGMIATFNTISAAGTSDPQLLSGGISEALITTELGLMVAIPMLLVHAWLLRWVERREAMLEYDAIQVFGLEHPEQDDAG